MTQQLVVTGDAPNRSASNYVPYSALVAVRIPPVASRFSTRKLVYPFLKSIIFLHFIRDPG